MAHKFIIDDRTGQLYSDFSGRRITTAAEILKAERGLSPTIEVYSVNVATDSRAVTAQTITNGNLSLSIGQAGKAPDKGLIKAAWTVSGTTYESAHLKLEGLTADALASAFNSAVYPVYNAGGLNVDQIGAGKYLLTMNKVGAISGTPGLDVEACDPPSAVEVNTVIAGDSDTKAQYILSLAQSPVAQITSGSWSSATSGSYSGLSASISLNTTAMLASISRGERDFEISIVHSGQVLHRSGVTINESLDPTSAGALVITSPTLFTLGSNAVNQGETIAISGGLTYDGTTLAAPFLPLAGGTMTGAVAMGSQKITGLADGTASGDAINKGQLDGLIDNAPEALNTLNELAAALGDDVNFSTTVATNIATKLPLAGGTMTGAILNANGSAGNPSMSFSSDTDTGFYYASNTIYASFAGSAAWLFKGDYIGSSASFAAMITKAAGSQASPSYSFMSDTDSGMFRADADQLGFSVGGSEKMRLTSTGLGIGCTASTTLHIKSADPVIRLEDSAPDGIYGSIDGAGGSLVLDADKGAGAADSNIQFRVDNTEALRIDSSTDLHMVAGRKLYLYPTSAWINYNNWVADTGQEITINNVGSSGIRLQTGSTTRFAIDNAGAATFSGAVTVGSDGAGHDVTFHSSTASRAMLWDASVKALKLSDLTTFAVGSSDDLQVYHTTHSYIENTTNDLYINNLATGKDTIFKNDNDSGTSTELLRLDGSTSRIGISTSAPSRKLTVAVSDGDDGIALKKDGSSNDLFQFRMDGTNDRGELFMYNAGTCIFAVRPTNVGYINTGQNFGIGVTAPTSPLHIEGPFTISRTGVTASHSTIDMDGNFRFAAYTGYNITFHSDENNIGGTEIVRFASDGKVGVGNSNPAQKLSIQFADTDTSYSGGTGGDWGSEGLLIENTSGTTDTMAMIQLRNGDADIHLAGIRQGTNDSDLGFFFEGSEKMRLDSDGQLKITGSQDSDDCSFYLHGGVMDGSFFGTDGRLTVKSGTALQFGDSSASIKRDGGTFKFYMNGDIQFLGPGSSDVNLHIESSNRYVGIGTTSPGSILEIQGDGGNNKQLRLASGSSSVYWDLGRNYSTGHFEITEDSGDTYLLIDKDNGTVELAGGALALSEISTPTAKADWGKIYTKSDNKLYFQDGAGTEHEIAFA